MLKNRVSNISASFTVFIIFIAATVLLIAGASSVAYAKRSTGEPMTFGIPGEAVVSLVEAIRKGDDINLFEIFGKNSKETLSSGDEVADRLEMTRLAEGYRENNVIRFESPDKAVLHVGKDERPFPIPIVKKSSGWLFDINAGKEKLINRRISKNELNAIEVLQAYADAQRKYAEKDRDGDGILEYAQEIVSEKGKKDGLYWDAAEGYEESPIGQLISEASREGYTKIKEPGALTPFRGYYYKILKSQGPNAAGGAYEYVVKNDMTLGFAIIAWPVKYGSSGITTLMINQAGVVYGKNLGGNTGQAALSIKTYDPDKTWKKFKEKNEMSAKSAVKQIK